MAIPTIPQILTKADWDREKGIIAKIPKIGIGETGIGAQMEKLKGTYNAVDWNKLDARTAFPRTPSDPAQVDEALKEAKAEYASKVEKVRAELRVLQNLAEKAAALFKSKTLVPKTSTEHAKKIATAADLMAVQLKSMDAELKSFADMKDRVIRNREAGLKAITSYMGKMAPAISALESKPDLEAYRSFNKEIVRGLSAAIKAQKELAPTFSGPWATFSSDPYQPKDVGQIKPKLAQVKQEYLKLKAAVGS